MVGVPRTTGMDQAERPASTPNSPRRTIVGGKNAVAPATKACDLTQHRDADYLETLAAAHAEAAQFEQAVKRARDAIEKASNAERAAIENRLKLYEAGKPLRESKVSSQTAATLQALASPFSTPPSIPVDQWWPP